ncbi:MAG TPA: pitrilysin family protein, partial [Candidatus Limnocylindrales bacterium]|nr:pitrilysin family protein [Candidatus Limnocylindrales bacterium]
GLQPDRILDFWGSAYRPANVVISIAGDLGHEEAVELAGAAFGRGNGHAAAWEPAPSLPAGPRVRLGRRDTTQAQLSVGVPGLRRDHPDAWSLAILNVVLGDGMSSRLFLSVVDRDALAYDVSSGIVEYADAGALVVSAGVDPARIQVALDALLVELARLRDEPVPADELAKAKAYLAGGLELRMEETRHLASWVGGQEALHDRVLTLDEALAEVAAVTSDDVHRVARTLIADDVLRLAAVAPGRHLRNLDRRLRLP